MTTDITCAELYTALKYRIVADHFGTRRYYNSAGELHRVEGPAIEWANGSKEWRQNGKLHRDVGPAVVFRDGTYAWYQNGLTHRTDGPAVKLANGTYAWYLHGVEYTKSEYHTALKAMGIQNDR